jgi:transcriptional regulator with GAF, ATPase, and Fis domain
LWLSGDSRSEPHNASPWFEDEQTEEQKIIEAALAASRGRVWGPEGAAVKLGIPPSTLDYKIKVLKIRKNKFRFR